VVTATLLAGERPVADREVAVLVSGDDVSRVAVTGADGRATVTVPLPSGTVTVAVTTEAPGAVQAYRGAPASPNPLGGQTLVVAGPPRHLQATASVDVPAPTTTTTPTTTAVPTTTAPVTTVASTTSTSSTVAALPPTTIAPSTTAPAPHPPLPTTGRGGDGVVAQFATAFLVGGIGLLGTLRRRNRGPRPAA
jgi:hypothetical protein